MLSANMQTPVWWTKMSELKIVMKMHSEQGEITVQSSFVILNVTHSRLNDSTQPFNSRFSP